MNNSSAIQVPFYYTSIYTMPAIAAPLYAIGQNYVDTSSAFYWNGGVIIFYSRGVSYPYSSWSYVVIDKNGNYTCVNMPVKNTIDFVISSITPLGYGFLVICANRDVYVIVPPRIYINNKTQIINTQFTNKREVCGQFLMSAYPTEDGVFLQTAVPNSQNGGYIYVGFYDKTGSLVVGGLQGTYEGSEQTFSTYSNYPSSIFTQNPQYLTNGLGSCVVYNYTTDLYELGLVSSSYGLGVSTCGPLPPNFPFPGNYSGAFVNYSYSSSLSLNLNDFQEYAGIVDSNQRLIGCVNPNFSNATKVSVLVYDGYKAYNFLSSNVYFFVSAVISDSNLFVVSSMGSDVVLGSINYELGAPANFTKNSTPLYNLKYSALSSLSSKKG